MKQFKLILIGLLVAMTAQAEYGGGPPAIYDDSFSNVAPAPAPYQPEVDYGGTDYQQPAPAANAIIQKRVVANQSTPQMVTFCDFITKLPVMDTLTANQRISTQTIVELLQAAVPGATVKATVISFNNGMEVIYWRQKFYQTITSGESVALAEVAVPVFSQNVNDPLFDSQVGQRYQMNEGSASQVTSVDMMARLEVVSQKSSPDKLGCGYSEPWMVMPLSMR